ncbi:CHASE2 domain-containing protein [Laspinema palackyanum]|uniref:CHASE2 domain-containing protein n=1 Tax=Laspinema palackyanum TaxID=3231601 RepID=UPI00345DFAFE|nr:adenylate/guanylate cyclase domain-containing protein [Laspinema sp. D2c]
MIPFIVSKLNPLAQKVREIIPQFPGQVAIPSLTITALLLGVRQLGGLQPLELILFDAMTRIRPDPGPDPRLLIVEITEQDIANQGTWPFSDRLFAEVLEELQRHQPIAIGLDIVRDIPTEPGHQELLAQLQQPNVIAITTLGNEEKQRVSAPAGISAEQIGFNDIAIDPDGRVRRNLMFASQDGTTFPSFSLQLARFYLKNQGIEPMLTEAQEYQLGNAIFSKLKFNSGGYQSLDAGGYQTLLNYRTESVARKISFTEAIARDFDPEWVRDKIIFIGATAPTLKDLFYTPYSRGIGQLKMPGVVIHGQKSSQILSAVLDDKPLFWFMPEWGEILWIVFWGMSGSLVVQRFHNSMMITGSVFIALGLIFSIGYSLILTGGWIPLAAPATAFICTSLFGVMYQRQLAGKQQQMVMNLLGQQTSPEIATALWTERDRLLESGMLPWQTLKATILFTDLKNFSTLSETKTPEELMTWLNPYLSAMTDEVLNHHGIVNKFTGDGIMAAFGVPIPSTTPEQIAKDAENAVSAALAMSRKLQELNQTWQQEGLPKVQMRIGIFTGPITVGSLGGKHRLEYGIIGDSVNTASRLESCEKQRHPDDCRILIARETLVHILDKFKVESWGALPLKGKSKTIEVYRVIDSSPK